MILQKSYLGLYYYNIFHIRKAHMNYTTPKEKVCICLVKFCEKV